MGCRWTYVKKYDEHGNVSRYKARLVAQGYSQIPGVDYTETFAPVVRLESVRAALGIAAIEDLEIGQMDIKGAYLNGELKKRYTCASLQATTMDQDVSADYTRPCTD